MTHCKFWVFFAGFIDTQRTMTNKGGAKQHGGHKINERRRKSGLKDRANKAKARERRAMLKAEHGLAC